MDPALSALLRATQGDPFAVLGPHPLENGQVWVRALLPGASEVSVIAGEGTHALPVEHGDGLFAGAVPLACPQAPYRLRAQWPGSSALTLDDPYRFPPLLGEMDSWLLSEGSHQRPWQVLGAHCRSVDGVAGVGFAVWAPNAGAVSVIGDFNGWDKRRHPMRRHVSCGVWDLFVPGVDADARYKFALCDAHGKALPDKADPYAFFAERRPATASIVAPALAQPQAFDRAAVNDADGPLAIYEVHAGSWRRREGGGGKQPFLSWPELADALAGYSTELGFTHVQLLPVTEHPFDGSWGYQPTALFAPSSRFGRPRDFLAFVDTLHAAGIGVLLDWVPAHFPADAHGLARFDGTCLYEHLDPRRGRHPDWNTLIYNLGRREVSNYLVASALYWLEEFGIDGLRVDAVASMLYLDYSRPDGQWVANRYGGRENLEAVAFLREVNSIVRERHPHALMIAEESTAWPKVTAAPQGGGLGFHFKWNMGWMNDTLTYVSRDPIYRRYHHDDLTFGFTYAHSERFILPLSHDEVVHGKRSLLGKMPGDRWRRFANLRAYLGFMYAHPGKKLLFMGGEFGQWREWHHDRSLDWHLLEDADHRGLQQVVRDLNRLYRSDRALHRGDNDSQGFEWISGEDVDQGVVAFLRREPGGEALVVAVSHFTPEPLYGYRVGVPHPGRYRECFNSDAEVYGGSGIGNFGALEAEPVPFHGRAYSLALSLPPLATVMFQWQPTR